MEVRILGNRTLRVKTNGGLIYSSQEHNPWTVIGLIMRYGGKCSIVLEHGVHLKIGQQLFKLGDSSE